MCFIYFFLYLQSSEINVVMGLEEQQMKVFSSKIISESKRY